MEINDELIKLLKDVIFKNLNDETNIDEFVKGLKECSEKTGVDYSTLLKLTLDKDFLYENVYYEIDKLESEIKKVKNELSELESRKYKLASLICHLHGHVYDDVKHGEYRQFCNVCGSIVRTPDGTLPYLNRKYILEKRFYKEDN